MALAPWRSPLARALHRNRSLPNARYFQLATVRLDGRPANRTVVFRGFLDNTNQLKIVTDNRSAKAEHIAHCPYAEACWYFPSTREQFRLSGQLTLIRAENESTEWQALRQRSWQELSDAARTQFAWAHPGQPRDDEGFDPPLPNPHVPLSQFCLLLLDPSHVDHLELRGTPQNRWVYQLLETGWIAQEVNP